MYGLINNSLKSMILEQFGEEQWQKVLSSSGVSEDSFLTMRSYDDSITYSLAGAAAEVLGAPVEVCLEMFGEYWVLETATKSYGMLLNATGQDMIEFLGNMNALHDRITSTFLNYTPPEFFIETKESHHLIHYVSQREGLTPFVVGLLKGLAKRFNSTLTIISQSEVAVDHGAHTIFEVEILAA
ncbi:MAG: heme NO-binding domain-containing protein [Halioglobus sp.]